MESEKKVIEYPRIFRLIYSRPSKTRFIVEDIEEVDIDKIFEIKFVIEIIYNKKTKILEIGYDPIIPLRELLKGLKSKIPRVIFYKNSNATLQGGETYASTIIDHLIKKGDDTIKDVSKGFANSQDLILLTTFAMAIEELLRNPVMPHWYDWLRFSQSAYSNIQLKQEIESVEEEIKVVDEDIYSTKLQSLNQISAGDIKKLIKSIEELKSIIEKKVITK